MEEEGEERKGRKRRREKERKNFGETKRVSLGVRERGREIESKKDQKIRRKRGRRRSMDRINSCIHTTSS